jgi:transcription initiation factor TFIIB
MIDRRPEWRSFTPEEKEAKTRVGPTSLLSIPDKGLSTSLNWRDRDTYGKELPLATQQQMRRLQRLNWRVSFGMPGDKGLAEAMKGISFLGEKLNLPPVVKEGAAQIYRKAHHKKVLKGRSNRELAAGALLIACRKAGVPKSLKEVARVSRLPKKKVGRSYRLLQEKLNLRIPLLDPISYLHRIAGKTYIKPEVEALALHIIKEANKTRKFVGKGPRGIAAASLYLACKLYHEGKTQREIARFADVTEVTVRSMYKRLAKELLFELYL